MKHFGGISVAEFSSTLSGRKRRAILNDFSTGKTKLIICSDAMSRGLDLESVQYVLSYDPPASSKTYIHRVGRTARAGRTGACTLYFNLVNRVDVCKLHSNSIEFVIYIVLQVYSSLCTSVVKCLFYIYVSN